MSWKQRVEDAYRERGGEVRADFRQGAPEERLADLEHRLGVALPKDLRELLEASDGLGESMLIKDEWLSVLHVVWSSEAILSRNQQTASAKEYLSFADAGVDGIVFAFRIDGSGDPAVYGYYPLEQEWRRVSDSLQSHLRGWRV